MDVTVVPSKRMDALNSKVYTILDGVDLNYLMNNANRKIGEERPVVFIQRKESLYSPAKLSIKAEVIDPIGRKGSFNFTIDFSPSDLIAMFRAAFGPITLSKMLEGGLSAEEMVNRVDFYI